MTNWTIWAIVSGYFSLLIGLAIWSSRGSRDLAGYYLAGRRLPAIVVAFSAASTGESAWLLLGLTGMGYLLGANALWIVFGEVLAAAIAWTFVAPRFRRLADRFEAITVADWLEERFSDRRQILRILGSAVIVAMAGSYMAAQLTGTGKAFESFVGISYEAGVTLGAAVILFYTSLGGLRAVAWSDLLQASLMLLAVIVLPWAAVREAGGLSEVAARLAEIEPAMLLPMGADGISGQGIATVLSHLGVGLAFLGAPQLLVRFMAAKDRRALEKGGVMAVIAIAVFDIGAVLTGMAGRALHPRIADPEGIFPLLAGELMPPVITGLLLVAVLAAIMSTADSVLLLASSSVVRDLLQRVFGVGRDGLGLTRIGKVTTVLLGLIGLAVALPEVRVIFFFVLFSWSGLGCAFAPVVILGICWRRMTLAGAVAGMAAGFGTSVIWFLQFKADFFDLFEMVPGFAAGFAAAIVVSLLTAPDPKGARLVETAAGGTGRGE